MLTSEQRIDLEALMRKRHGNAPLVKDLDEKLMRYISQYNKAPSH